MLEKGTYISDEVLNEGIIDNIGYKLGLKKKSGWQRFKNTIKNNKGKAAVAAGILGLGVAGALRDDEEPLVYTTKITHHQSNWPEEYRRIRRRINDRIFWYRYMNAMYP